MERFVLCVPTCSGAPTKCLCQYIIDSSLEGKELTLCRAATPSDPQLHLGLRDTTVPALVSVPLLTDKATTLSCPLDHVAPPQFLGFWREGTVCKDPGRAAV